MKNRVLTVLLLVTGLVVGVAGPAHAHFLGSDSVDGAEIRYTDHTQYNDALNYAIARWEELPGGVSIAPDSSTTINDLKVSDYSSSGDGLCGKWVASAGEDDIKLNSHNFANYSSPQKRACMTHEWGHAHGLNHSFVTQVLDACPVCFNPSIFAVPQNHDRADYATLWN